MTDPTSVRKTLYAALMADGITGRGHSPDRSAKASALIEAFRDQATESLRVRLWLIEQYVTRITAADNPIAIGLDLTPWLDGPIHRDDVAAYRAARTTAAQEG